MNGDYLYHVDGELVVADRATVSVRDRGFAYGDAAFETLRAYNDDVFEWDAHADRLERTCKALSLNHGIARADLHERIEETLEANDLADAYVRLSITRGVQPGKLTPDPEVDPTVVVVIKDLPRGGVDGIPVWEGPAVVERVSVQSVPDESLPSGAKTHSYLPNVLARAELSDGADEALLCDGEGAVLEGAASNVFHVSDGILHTPAAERALLPGVTRRVVLDLAAEAGIPTQTGDYDPDDLRTADEAFLTNTTWEVRPVETIDDARVGGGPITDQLTGLFDRLIERRHYR